MNRVSTRTIIEADAGPRKTTLRPAEIALIGTLGFLFVLSLIDPSRATNSTRAALIAVATLLTLAALALGTHKDGWRYWGRELLPVPVIPFIYLNLGTFIPVVNASIEDPRLLAWDRRILGPEVQNALYALPMPWWLADLLTLAYSTFFFLPLVLFIALALRRDPNLPRITGALVFTFLLSYAGYFVVPAHGPRAEVAQARYETLPAGAVGATVRDLLDNWERTKTDAFPSGHTMVTLAVLFFARRRIRPLYHVLLPVGALLIAATVLLTYHYVVDVVAAVPLTAAALALSALVHGRVPARHDLTSATVPSIQNG